MVLVYIFYRDELYGHLNLVIHIGIPIQLKLPTRLQVRLGTCCRILVINYEAWALVRVFDVIISLYANIFWSFEFLIIIDHVELILLWHNKRMTISLLS